MVVAVAVEAAETGCKMTTTHPADILLVDDDPDLLKLISLRLSSAGYRVRTADSGEAALSSLAVARPGVVISDLRMPGIDGLQLPRHDGNGLAGLALVQRLADAEHRLQVL